MEAITIGSIIVIASTLAYIYEERRERMARRVTLKDKKEFAKFCKQANNDQLLNIYAKERDANRKCYELIAKYEIERRKI